jgi:hypothetical protein
MLHAFLKSIMNDKGFDYLEVQIFLTIPITCIIIDF